MSREMSSRERLRAVLAHGIPDRIPMVDICAWPETIERWRKEGLPADVEFSDYFGHDRVEMFGFDGSLRLPPETLEQNDRYRIDRDANGVTIKSWVEGSAEYSPQCRVGCTVKDWDGWLKVKDRLQVDPSRIGDYWNQVYPQWREQGRFVVLSPLEPAWFLIETLTGFEDGLPLLAAEPELALDIMTTYTDFTLGMCQCAVDQGFKFDALWFFSDLCYKNGMLFSPRCYRETVMPLHRRFREWCTANNLPMMLHCDGDVRRFVPLLIEVGFDAIQPLEARCGNDVRGLKSLYGTDIVFFGNIAADVLAYGTDAEVEEEVTTKILAAKQGGGYIYHIDHSIPPTISFERYSRVMELVREHGAYE